MKFHPEPCKDCPMKRACSQAEIACEAYAIYTQGPPHNRSPLNLVRWERAIYGHRLPRDPTPEIYKRIFREDAA